MHLLEGKQIELSWMNECTASVDYFNLKHENYNFIMKGKKCKIFVSKELFLNQWMENVFQERQIFVKHFVPWVILSYDHLIFGILSSLVWYDMVWYWYCYGCWNWRIGIAFKKSKYPFFISDLVEVQDPASGSDWVKDLVVDDGVDG